MSTSLRDVAEWVDPETPPRYLYGNGPPFDDGRPDYLPQQVVEVYRTTHTDPRSANLPRHLEIGEEAMPDAQTLDAIETLASYDGVVYLDAPERDAHPTIYRQNLVAAYLYAYDLGLINRTPDNGSLPAGYTDKGLVEAHRWDAAQEADGTYRSLRAVASRHDEGVRHRIGWQNVKLEKTRSGVGPAGDGARKRVARYFGRLFAAAGYDVVGMCELSRPTYLDEFADAFEDDVPDGIAAQYGKKSLHDLGIAVREGERSVSNWKTGAFDSQGPGVNQEGWQLAVVEVPELDAAFEVVVTHLQGTVDPWKDRTKARGIEQMEEVRDLIEGRQERHPERPTVLLGDFNIHSRSEPIVEMRPGEYYVLFQSQMGEIDMQNVSLTRGGPIDATKEFRAKPGSALCVAEPFEPPDGTTREEAYRKNRIDYAFVEAPSPDHEMTVDVTRTVEFAPSPDCLPEDLRDAMDAQYFDQDGCLSDHPGIGLEILTAPR